VSLIDIFIHHLHVPILGTTTAAARVPLRAYALTTETKGDYGCSIRRKKKVITLAFINPMKADGQETEL